MDINFEVSITDKKLDNCEQESNIKITTFRNKYGLFTPQKYAYSHPSGNDNTDLERHFRDESTFSNEKKKDNEKAADIFIFSENVGMIADKSTEFNDINIVVNYNFNFDKIILLCAKALRIFNDKNTKKEDDGSLTLIFPINDSSEEEKFQSNESVVKAHDEISKNRGFFIITITKNLNLPVQDSLEKINVEFIKNSDKENKRHSSYVVTIANNDLNVPVVTIANNDLSLPVVTITNNDSNLPVVTITDNDLILPVKTFTDNDLSLSVKYLLEKIKQDSTKTCDKGTQTLSFGYLLEKIKQESIKNVVKKQTLLVEDLTEML